MNVTKGLTPRDAEAALMHSIARQKIVWSRRYDTMTKYECVGKPPEAAPCESRVIKAAAVK